MPAPAAPWQPSTILQAGGRRKERVVDPIHPPCCRQGRGVSVGLPLPSTSAKSRAATTGTGCGAPSGLSAQLGSFSFGSSRNGSPSSKPPPRQFYLSTTPGLAAGPRARPVPWEEPSVSRFQPFRGIPELRLHLLVPSPPD